MRALRFAGLAVAFSACLAGCVATGVPYTVIPAGKSSDAIAVGKSTKADVLAALGKTTVVSFESGFEVWVYQTKGHATGSEEFVILFAPSGVVAKTRVRPNPPRSEAKRT